jgi:hypothetical protein
MKMKVFTKILHVWVPVHDCTNNLDGHKRYLQCKHWRDESRHWQFFRTRRECLEYIKENHGYIAKRPDLRREPHCWRVPKPVRVTVTVTED